MDPHRGPLEDQSNVIRNLETSVITFSTVFLIIRLYSRLGYTKNAGLDDVIAVVAWALICTQSSLELIAAHRWTGRHIWTLSLTQINSFFSHLQKLEMLFFVSTGIVRLSIVAFLPRLNRNKSVPFHRMIVSLATTIFITMAFFVIFATVCKPSGGIFHQNPMSRCLFSYEQRILLCTHQALGAVFDLCLLCVPIWLVYTHMTFNWRTVKVMLVFGVGLFVFTVDIVRLVIVLKVDMSKDTTWNIVHISIWTALEIHVGFWVACFPAFVPLIRYVYDKVVPSMSNFGSLPVFNPARSLGAKPRMNPLGFTSTSDATASENRNMTNTDGSRSSMNLELADAKSWTDIRATTSEANEDALSHNRPVQLHLRDRRQSV